MYGGLVVPSVAMINFPTALEDEFVQFFSNLTKVFDIAKDLLNKLLSIHLNIECQDFDKEFLLMLFIRTRIYYCLKFENRQLATSKKRRNKKFIKVTHL